MEQDGTGRSFWKPKFWKGQIFLKQTMTDKANSFFSIFRMGKLSYQDHNPCKISHLKLARAR